MKIMMVMISLSKNSFIILLCSACPWVKSVSTKVAFNWGVSGERQKITLIFNDDGFVMVGQVSQHETH